MGVKEFEVLIAPAIEIAFAGPLPLALVGVALILALKAALRIAGVIFVILAIALLFGGVTLGDLGAIALDLADTLARAADALAQASRQLRPGAANSSPSQPRVAIEPPIGTATIQGGCSPVNAI